MRQFEPAANPSANPLIEVRETVRSAVLLTLTAVLLTFSLVNGGGLLPRPPVADPILYAPISW